LQQEEGKRQHLVLFTLGIFRIIIKPENG